MKFKSVNTDDDSKLIYDVRYNPNIDGEALNIKDGISDMDKRTLGVSTLLSLMCLRGYYDKAKKELKSTDEYKIVNQMIDNAKKYVNDSAFIHSDEEEWG
jgi:hypothetical protein